MSSAADCVGKYTQHLNKFPKCKYNFKHNTHIPNLQLAAIINGLEIRYIQPKCQWIGLYNQLPNHQNQNHSFQPSKSKRPHISPQAINFEGQICPNAFFCNQILRQRQSSWEISNPKFPFARNSHFGPYQLNPGVGLQDSNLYSQFQGRRLVNLFQGFQESSDEDSSQGLQSSDDEGDNKMSLGLTGKPTHLRNDAQTRSPSESHKISSGEESGKNSMHQEQLQTPKNRDGVQARNYPFIKENTNNQKPYSKNRKTRSPARSRTRDQDKNQKFSQENVFEKPKIIIKQKSDPNERQSRPHGAQNFIKVPRRGISLFDDFQGENK